jgi:hypothetical protein
VRPQAGPGPLPLALRNALAELILDAFGDHRARRTLEALARLAPDAAPAESGDAGPSGAPPWIEGDGGSLRVRPGYRAYLATLRVRAQAGLAAVETAPGPIGDDLATALGRAEALAGRGLYFEVHELLEPLWLRASGDGRVALQGLIQAAVGLQHLVHGNRAGARALVASGLDKTRAARGALPLDTAAWEAGLDRLLAALGGLGTDDRPSPAIPAWPGPCLRDLAMRIGLPGSHP